MRQVQRRERARGTNWHRPVLADHGVLHDGVAEVIHYRRDGEDAAQPLKPCLDVCS
jgi:hypothetical protein